MVSPQFDLNHFTSKPFTELLESYNKYEEITDIPRYIGVVDMQLHNVKLRVTFKTLNQKHWGIERDLRKDIHNFLQEMRQQDKVF